MAGIISLAFAHLFWVGTLHADCTIYPRSGNLHVDACEIYNPDSNGRIRAEAARRQNEAEHLTALYRIQASSEVTTFVDSYRGVIVSGDFSETPAGQPMIQSKPEFIVVPLWSGGAGAGKKYLLRTHDGRALCQTLRSQGTVNVHLQPNCCDGDTGAPCLMIKR